VATQNRPLNNDPRDVTPACLIAEFHRRLSEDPAVITAAYAVHLPGNGNRFQVQFPSLKPGDLPVVTSARVGIHYFAAFKQPLVAGRYCTPSEIDAASKVAVLSTRHLCECCSEAATPSASSCATATRPVA